MPLLTEEQISTRIQSLDGWMIDDDSLCTTYEFEDFVHAIGFVCTLAFLAEKANHHPDIQIEWNKVSLTLSTHSEGGLTEKDFMLAEQIEAL